MIDAKIIGGVAALAGLFLLGGAAYAHSNASTSTATPGSDSSDDADSNVFISSFVVKDGQCYRVTVGNGSSTSTPVDMSNCANPGDLGRARMRWRRWHWR